MLYNYSTGAIACFLFCKVLGLAVECSRAKSTPLLAGQPTTTAASNTTESALIVMQTMQAEAFQ